MTESVRKSFFFFFGGKILRTRRARGGTPLRNGAILCFIRDSIFYPAVSSSRNEHNRKLCATDVLPGKNAACPKYFRCCVKLAPALAKKVWWLMEYASKHVQVCAFLWNVKMLQTAGFCCELLDGEKTSFFFLATQLSTQADVYGDSRDCRFRRWQLPNKLSFHFWTHRYVSSPKRGIDFCWKT